MVNLSFFTNFNAGDITLYTTNDLTPKLNNFQITVYPNSASQPVNFNGNVEIVYKYTSDNIDYYGLFQLIDTSKLDTDRNYTIYLVNQQSTTLFMPITPQLTLSYLNNQISSFINTDCGPTTYCSNGYITVGDQKYGCVCVDNQSILGNIQIYNSLNVPLTFYIGVFDKNYVPIPTLNRTIYLNPLGTLPFLLNQQGYMEIIAYDGNNYTLYSILDFTQSDLDLLATLNMTKTPSTQYSLVPSSNTYVGYILSPANSFITLGNCTSSSYYTLGSANESICANNVGMKLAIQNSVNNGNQEPQVPEEPQVPDEPTSDPDDSSTWKMIIIIIVIVIVLILVIGLIAYAIHASKKKKKDQLEK